MQHPRESVPGQPPRAFGCWQYRVVYFTWSRCWEARKKDFAAYLGMGWRWSVGWTADGALLALDLLPPGFFFHDDQPWFVILATVFAHGW